MTRLQPCHLLANRLRIVKLLGDASISFLLTERFLAKHICTVATYAEAMHGMLMKALNVVAPSIAVK